MEMITDMVKQKYFDKKGLSCEKPPSSCMSYGMAGTSFQLLHFIQFICSYLSLHDGRREEQYLPECICLLHFNIHIG